MNVGDFFYHENIVLTQSIFFVYLLEGNLYKTNSYNFYPSNFDIKKYTVFNVCYFLFLASAIVLSFELKWWKAVLYIVLVVLWGREVIGALLDYLALTLSPKKRKYVFFWLSIISYVSMFILLVISIYVIGSKIFS